MGTASGEAIGSRIRRARREAGLTQEALALVMDLDRSALAKVETGGRKVSALELATAAEHLGVRLEWFVDATPESVVSMRERRDPVSAAPTIEVRTEEIVRHVEFVQRHDPVLQGIPTQEQVAFPATDDDIERCAGRARDLLGIGTADPLWDLSRRVGAAGLLTFSCDLGVDSADGACVLLEAGGVALVNGQLNVGRRRLTLAHEFGHFLFADPLSVDWSITNPHPREAKIDRFARALLLPAQTLKRVWSDHLAHDRSTRQAAVLTASAFRVDMTTLSSRAVEIDLMSAGLARDIRTIRTTRSDIVEMDLLVSHELDPPELAQPYVEAVLRLFRAEIISPERALDLLLDVWDVEDLPDLDPLPENAIWSFV